MVSETFFRTAHALNGLKSGTLFLSRVRLRLLRSVPESRGLKGVKSVVFSSECPA